jgi:hypothetical protein
MGGGEVTFDEHACFIKNTYDDIEERVFPESVCEFTGKRDRLCNDLYEGDVLNDDVNGNVMVVMYDDDHGMVMTPFNDPDSKAALTPELLGNMRLIGNIYD